MRVFFGELFVRAVHDVPRHLHVDDDRLAVVEVYEHVFAAAMGLGNFCAFHGLAELCEKFWIGDIVFTDMEFAPVICPRIRDY